MTDEESRKSLEKVSEIAMLAGIRGRVDDAGRQFEAAFELEGGRSQHVFVRVAGCAADGATVVNIFSPCHVFKTGFLKGLGKSEALALLQQNERVYFARYGLWAGTEEEMIVASVDRSLERLDHGDFHQLVWHVAIAADAVEKQHGADRF